MYTPSPALLARLRNDHVYHPPIAELSQAKRYEAIRLAALNFGTYLLTQCPESRELSTALTNLDAVVFFANASIARNEK